VARVAGKDAYEEQLVPGEVVITPAWASTRSMAKCSSRRASTALLKERA
jgi:hypothetical protein